MSEKPKISIEKRIIKLENNEKFILEYPSNYEEIIDKKLNNLQKEYESVTNNNINNDQNKNNMQSESIEKGNNNKTINEKDINENNNNNNSDIYNNNNYYQPIGIIDNFSNDDGNEIIKENKKYMEPKEGTIEIKSIRNEIKNENSKNVKEEDNNEEEFYEVEEKENDDNNNNIKEKKINDDSFKEAKKIDKKNVSPVKNSENIKSSMRKLSFKTPKWAEKMTDEDFINMAKKIISSNNK